MLARLSARAIKKYIEHSTDSGTKTTQLYQQQTMPFKQQMFKQKHHIPSENIIKFN